MVLLRKKMMMVVEKMVCHKYNMAYVERKINKFVDVGAKINNVMFFSFNNPTSFSIYNLKSWS